MASSLDLASSQQFSSKVSNISEAGSILLLGQLLKSYTVHSRLSHPNISLHAENQFLPLSQAGLCPLTTIQC